MIFEATDSIRVYKEGDLCVLGRALVSGNKNYDIVFKVEDFDRVIAKVTRKATLIAEQCAEVISNLSKSSLDPMQCKLIYTRNPEELQLESTESGKDLQGTVDTILKVNQKALRTIAEQFDQMGPSSKPASTASTPREVSDEEDQLTRLLHPGSEEQGGTSDARDPRMKTELVSDDEPEAESEVVQVGLRLSDQDDTTDAGDPILTGIVLVSDDELDGTSQPSSSRAGRQLDDYLPPADLDGSSSIPSPRNSVGDLEITRLNPTMIRFSNEEINELYEQDTVEACWERYMDLNLPRPKIDDFVDNTLATLGIKAEETFRDRIIKSIEERFIQLQKSIHRDSKHDIGLESVEEQLRNETIDETPLQRLARDPDLRKSDKALQDAFEERLEDAKRYLKGFSEGSLEVASRYAMRGLDELKGIDTRKLALAIQGILETELNG